MSRIIRIQKLSKFHIVAILLSLVIAALFVLPHFIMADLLAQGGLEYHPLSAESGLSDENQLYLPRTAAVSRGQLIAGDISLYEYSGGPSLLPILNPMMTGALSFFTESIENTYVVATGLYSALIFLILYGFFYLLSRSRILALFVAFVYMTFRFVAIRGIPPTSLEDATWWLSHFMPFFNGNPQILSMAHFQTPLETFIFFGLVLAGIVWTLRKQSYIPALLTGVGFGTLFYTYFYHWVFISIMLGILVVLTILRKEYDISKRLGLVLIVGFLMSIWYWIDIYLLQQIPYWSDLMFRTGLETSHAIRVFVWKRYLLYGMLLASVWYLFRKEDKVLLLFGMATALSMFAMWNVQIITGIVPQSDHWIWGVESLMLWVLYAIVGAGLWRYLKPNYKAIGTFVLSGLIVLLGVHVVSEQQAYAKTNYERFTQSSDMTLALDWINKNTLPSDVLVTPSIYTNTNLLLYTDTYIFAPNSLHTLASNDEIRDRYLRAFYVLDVESKQIRELLGNSEFVTYVFHLTYHDRSLDSYLIANTKLPPSEVVQKWVSDYESIGPNDLFASYKADYIFIGPFEEEFGGALRPGLDYDIAYQNESISIYRTNPIGR